MGEVAKASHHSYIYYSVILDLNFAVVSTKTRGAFRTATTSLSPIFLEPRNTWPFSRSSGSVNHHHFTTTTYHIFDQKSRQFDFLQQVEREFEDSQQVNKKNSTFHFIDFTLIIQCPLVIFVSLTTILLHLVSLVHI